MDTPSILLAGLRLNKALERCAPEEYAALSKTIECMIATAGPESPPEQKQTNALAVALAGRVIICDVDDKDALADALSNFYDALERHRDRRSDINALCCAITLYRHRISR